MGATGRRIASAAVAALFAAVLYADESSDALATIHRVAAALSANNAAEAIAQFDPSCPGYDTLRNDFIGLTGAYNVANEATILDEQDSPGIVNLTLDWTITLIPPDRSGTKRRTGKIRIRVVRNKGKWKIAQLSPIELFDPSISHP